MQINFGLYQNGAYSSNYTFDRNGNIKTLSRFGAKQNGAAPVMMDNFVYHYEDGVGGTTTDPLYLNRLASVEDLASAHDTYMSDDVNSGQLANNYQYDASGQLVKDLQEGIEEIGWTATGKVKYIRFTAAAKAGPKFKRDVRFIYDPMDLRIAKIENTGASGKSFECTYYSYDASGNLLASYVRTFQAQGQGGTGPFEDILSLDEHYIYGASRLGAEKRDEIILEASALQSETQTANPLSMYSDLAFFFWSTPTIHPFEHSYREVGDKSFELSNHLGNVLVVVTDQKGPHTTPGNSYAPNVVSYSDYEPYGMLLEGRHGQDGVDYRYGFQGQEMDDKIKGEGNSANYKYRMHDPRIGRFFAIDPLAAKYPWYTPYQFSGNKVISCVELEGLEELDVNQVSRGKSADNGISSFVGGFAGMSNTTLRGGFNYNYSSSNRPGASSLIGNFSSSLNAYGRKNNIWALGLGSSSILSIGYQHNRNSSSFYHRNSGSGKLLPNNGFSFMMSIEAHFDFGVLHSISTITKSANFNFPTGDHSNIQFTFGNDFAWGGPLNFGYNAHHRTFGKAEDGGITQHMQLGFWWNDYNQGLMFQAWGTTAHRIAGGDGVNSNYLLSNETRKGRQLYETVNTPGSHFGIGQLTFYHTFSNGGRIGFSAGYEGQSMGAGLQDWIHFLPPFSQPGKTSYLFDWDVNDKPKFTAGISYSIILSANRPRYR